MTFFRSLWCLLACALWLPAAQAQTVEYTIPTEYDLVPGRLSVTFVDTLSEQAARAVLADLGYTVVDTSHFAPTVVEVVDASDLSPADLNALKAVSEIRDVVLVAGRLRLRLDPTLDRKDAANLVRRHIPNGRILGYSTRPHELIIVVPETKEETALERLEAHPLVRYVAYLMAE